MNNGFDPQFDEQEPVASLVDVRRERMTLGIPLLSLASIFLFASLAQVFLHLLFSLFLPALVAASWYGTLLSALSLYGIAMPFSLLIYRMVPSCAPRRQRMSLPVFLGLFAIAIALTYVGNLVGILVNAVIGVITGEPVGNEFAESVSSSSLWENLLTVGILAPIMEEIFFRKLMLDRIAHLGDVPAMLISGIAFGLVHGNFSQFFYAAAVGILFGYIYLRTGRIRYTIALHMCVNLLGGVWAPEMVKLLEKEAEELSFPLMLLQSPAGLLYLGYLLLVGLCFVGAIVAVVLLWRRIRFQGSQSPMTGKEWRSVLLFNPATVLFLLVVLLLFLN